MRHMIRGVALACVALTLPAATEAGAAPDRKADYAALAELPDLSGVWSPDWGSLFASRGAAAPTKPQFTPKAAKIVADYAAKQKEGENLQTDDANCIPPGMPRVMKMPYPIEFIVSPGRVTIATEAYEQVRRVYTDGRKLPDDPDPSFNGSSVGRWVDGGLEIDTIGVNPRVTIMPGLHPSEGMRIHERVTREGDDKLWIETTITDPELFTQPFTQKQAYIRKPGWEIREYICQENNKDHADEFGRPSMDIN